MGQLMGQEAPAHFSERGVSSRTEHYILSHSVGQRIHCLSRGRRFLICVDPYFAEVVTEARLHKGTRILIEGLPWRVKRLLYYRRRALVLCITGGWALQARLAAFGTLPID